MLTSLISEQNSVEMAQVQSAARNGTVCYHFCSFPEGPTLHSSQDTENATFKIYNNARFPSECFVAPYGCIPRADTSSLSIGLRAVDLFD